MSKFVLDHLDDPPPLGEEPNYPEHTQDPGEVHPSEKQQIVITSVRATDLTLGLRRMHAGFHVTIQVDGAEWQTSSKPVHIDQTIVEWNEHVLLPSEPSSEVRVSVCASFELEPMLGDGERLRTFEISVGELLDRSEKSNPIVFQHNAEEVVSPCSSLLITVEQRRFDENGAAVLRPISTLTSSDMHTLIQRTDAGHCILARYGRTQNSRDLDQSITHFEHVSDLCPVDHPCRPATLSNLAIAKFVRYQVNGIYLDLDTPISLFQDVLDMRPTGHPDRPITLLHLAFALLYRYAKRGFEADADMAVELLSDVMDISHANSQVYRAAELGIEISALPPEESIDANDCGQERPIVPLSPNELVHRAELCLQRDDPHALDEVISLHYDALRYHSTAHDQRGKILGNLGIMLHTRFERQGNSEDLDEAILLYREALALLQVGHADRLGASNNLAAGLSTRFEHRGNDQDLDEAIVLHREGLTLRPIGHPNRSTSLINLAIQLSTRFEHRGNDEDLDEAIPLQREALALLPVGHPVRSASLDNLANELSTRFKHRGNDEDLDEAIPLHREALALRPVGHPDRFMSLNNLANQLSNRFEHRGNHEDLDEAIPLHREALALLPVGHPDRSALLDNLAILLSARFKHRGNVEDLDEAIPLHREALALRPVGHPDRFMSLNNLAIRLSNRFEHRGNDEDLDEAIPLHREALALLPVDHPDRSTPSMNLANKLFIRFEHRGNDEDLDEAIRLHREVLALLPVGHTNRSMSLDNLANQLSTRFEHRGNDEDLDEAIPLHREALALLPVGHTDRSTSLISLANQLFARFKHQGNDEDLDEAILLNREALALLPVGHAIRPLSLRNLAAVLSSRFEHRGNDQDLDEAIVLHREALALRPVGHHDRSKSLSNLANYLSVRFEHRGNVQDLNESLENLRYALTLSTQHNPHHLIVHLSLAKIYLTLLLHGSGLDGTGQDTTNSLNTVMYHLKEAANVVSGGLLARLRASLLWVHHAAQHTHGTELEAYATSMQLLDTYLSATASVSSRHHTTKSFPHTLAVNAASCALHRGDVCRAVELLEQGRTLIWTQMARLRTPIDSLQERGDHAQALLKKFRYLSSLLDKPPPEREGTPRVDIEAEDARYRRLVEDWNKTVEDIRKLEGFGRFLLPPLISDLQDAARDGPIIMLIASESSCDAIIIPHEQPPTSIQLSIDLERLLQLVDALRETVDKDVGPKGTQPVLIKALRELWDDVVSPVVEILGRFARQGSRIWWCPTSAFNFLPLHAAGEYKRGGKSLSQLYISSYTPSLTALIRARRSYDRSSSASFAAIGQNHPPKASFVLESVEPELELVRSLLPPPPIVAFTKVTSVESTKSRVMDALQDNHWLHFACHGTQNFVEPFKSAFLMRDQPLSLLDITQTNLSQHEFAFLSACDTAVGDFGTPDEVIHLAAGLQFVGVKSVIGTLWKVNDATVRRLVEAFYKYFCGDSRMDSKRAARALHRAVQSLASDTDMPLDQRIVFMHIGL